MERPGYDPFPQRDHRAHRGSLGCERACYTVRKVNNWWAPVPEHRGALDLRFANDVWLHQLSLEISERLAFASSLAMMLKVLAVQMPAADWIVRHPPP